MKAGRGTKKRPRTLGVRGTGGAGGEKEDQATTTTSPVRMLTLNVAS